MTTIKRIQYHQYGGPEVMRLETFEAPSPRRGEVLVRVRAASANPMDWGLRAGAMKIVTGRKFPRGIGNDFAGVVLAIGEGVTRVAVGDEVLGGTTIKGAGTFGEMVIAEERGVVAKPANLTFEEAAAVPTVGLTAFQAIVRNGHVRAGQSVFIHGVLGGVGRSAAQFALSLGASVGGSCRPSAAADARELGVDPIVDFELDPAPLAGRFDLVLDTAGTLPIAAAKSMLQRGGRIIDIIPTPTKFLRSAWPGPFQVMLAKPITADLEEVARAAGAGTLRVPIARTVRLAEAIPALAELETHRTPKGGKLVIVV